MNLKSLLQAQIPNWIGKLAVHHVGYLGDGHVHRAVPYPANDPKIVTQKLLLMQSIGVDVVIETWQGPWAPACHQDALLFSSGCTKLGMQFALLLDPGGMRKWASNPTQAQITSNVEAALKDSGTQSMLNASSYISPKYILDFNTGANLTTLASAFPSLKFLAQGQGFSWVSIPNVTDSTLRNQAAVSNLKSQHANPNMTIASFCESFDDSGMPLPAGVQSQSVFDAAGGKRDLTQSVWGGPARILESFSGQFMQQQLATIPPTVPIIACVTWDDYDEQSSGPLERIVAFTQGVNLSVSGWTA